VNRFLAGIVGALGLGWLLKKRHAAVRHGAVSLRPPEAAVAEPEADPRAEELRARIEEAKAAGDDRDEFEAGETRVDEAGLDEAAADAGSVDDAAADEAADDQGAVDEADPAVRRAAVHEQARARISEMAAAQDVHAPVEDVAPPDASR
jgi:hypothetical protein